MTQDEFARMLIHGVVVFAFRKKDGSVRPAKGTLKMDLIPAALHPKGEAGCGASEAKPSTNQKYFDLEKNAWRSFSWETFGGVIG